MYVASAARIWNRDSFCCGASSLSAGFFNLVENVVLQQRRIRILFTIALQYRCSQSGATKSEHFSVPRRNHVFSCSRDTSECICRLPTSYRDRGRQILFLAPVRVLVGRSRSFAAQSPTQAHKI